MLRQDALLRSASADQQPTPSRSTLQHRKARCKACLRVCNDEVVRLNQTRKHASVPLRWDRVKLKRARLVQTDPLPWQLSERKGSTRTNQACKGWLSGRPPREVSHRHLGAKMRLRSHSEEAEKLLRQDGGRAVTADLLSSHKRTDASPCSRKRTGSPEGPGPLARTQVKHQTHLVTPLREQLPLSSEHLLAANPSGGDARDVATKKGVCNL